MIISALKMQLLRRRQIEARRHYAAMSRQDKYFRKKRVDLMNAISCVKVTPGKWRSWVDVLGERMLN